MTRQSGRSPKVSIILIREMAEQMTGSGCCGRLEGDHKLTGGGAAFQEVRRQQESFGILHRAVVEFFAEEYRSHELEIVTVDPRNQLYLIPKLMGDVWRYRPGVWSGLLTVCQFHSLPAVILNGSVLSRRDRQLDPDALCHAVSRLLAEPTTTATRHVTS